MKPEFFICQWDSPDDKEGDIYVLTHLRSGSLWKRIKNAIKYIFGHRSMYGDFDEFIFKKEDANKLQSVVDYLKSKT